MSKSILTMYLAIQPLPSLPSSQLKAFIFEFKLKQIVKFEITERDAIFEYVSTFPSQKRKIEGRHNPRSNTEEIQHINGGKQRWKTSATSPCH